MADRPPDNFVKDFIEWLTQDFYPNYLNEPIDLNTPEGQEQYNRAIAVWVSGDRGFIEAWGQGHFKHDPPELRFENLKHLMAKRIMDTKFPPARPEVVDPVHGQLRVEGEVFKDDVGPSLPVFCHQGDLFALYKFERDKALQDMDDMAEAGYFGPRFWTHLGGHYWESKGRAINGTREIALLDDFMSQLHNRSLSAVVSQGDVGEIPDRKRFMTDLAAISQKYRGVVGFIDGGNEAWQTGEADPNKLAQMLRWYMEAGGLGIRSLTSPLHSSELKEDIDHYCIDPAQIFDVHGYRGGQWYDKLRHMYSIIREEGGPRRRLGIQSEPFGYGELVTVTDNMHQLDHETMGLAAAQSLLSRQAYVWFSGEGVWRRQSPTDSPGYYQAPGIRKFLPADLMSYDITHGYHTNDDRVFTVHNDRMRCDQALGPNGEVVCTIYGPEPASGRMHQGFEGLLIHPGTLESQPVSYRRGDQPTIAFERGRLLVGKIK